MSDTQALPTGEWAARRNSAFWEVVVVPNGEEPSNHHSSVAHVWGIGDEDISDGPTSKANARLIAAAPELLEALKTVRCFYQNAKNLSGDEQDILDQVDAAIAKAKGEA